MNERISIMIGSKDRPTEVALLLQSLRTQTIQDFDVLLLDDASGTPYANIYFIVTILNRLKLEGHNVRVIRNNLSNGVSKMRNQSAQLAIEYFPLNDLLLRIDDDTIAEPKFLENLISVIRNGYDLASGVTPPMLGPDWKRETRFVEPIINRVVLDDLGSFLVNSDDCGYMYYEDKILPTHHFRSTALYKKTIHTEHNIWYEDNLTKSGIREEEFFSFRCILKGLKLGVHTGAVHFHLLTPSGGQRTETNDAHLLNQKMLNRFTKKKVSEYGNFINKYNERLGINRENEFSNLNKGCNWIFTKEE